MNPFTESTVARPLDDAEATWTSSGVQPGRPSRLKPDRHKTKRHPEYLPSPGVPPDCPPDQYSACHGCRRVMPTMRGRAARVRLLNVLVGACLGLTTAGVAGAVNVNAATQEQLQAIRGIGPKTAQIIIEERSRAGPYESFEDLSDRVKGIGPKKAETMKASGLKVEAGTVTAKAKPPANR